MDLAEQAQRAGHAFTACLLGDPIGAAGVAIMDGNQGQAWALFTPLIKTLPLGLYRAVSKGLREVIVETRLRKIYAVIDPEDEKAQRFMEHLGFRMQRLLYERNLENHQ